MQTAGAGTERRSELEANSEVDRASVCLKHRDILSFCAASLLVHTFFIPNN